MMAVGLNVTANFDAYFNKLFIQFVTSLLRMIPVLLLSVASNTLFGVLYQKLYLYHSEFEDEGTH